MTGQPIANDFKSRHSAAAGNGPIHPLPGVDDAWFVEVRFPLNFAISLRKTMTIVREGKELWLFNCARLDERTEASLEEMGKVTHVVSMSSHKHHDAYFQERFDAKLWTIEGLAYDQDHVRREYFNRDTVFPIEGGIKPLLAYSNDPSVELNFNEAVVFLPGRKLLIACDIIQNEFREDQFPEFNQGIGGRLINRMLRLHNVEMFTPPIFPGMLSKGGFRSLKTYLYSLADLDFDVCVTGHAAPCTVEPRRKWKSFLDSVDWERNRVKLTPRTRR
jgi:hypothetical protein